MHLALDGAGGVADLPFQVREDRKRTGQDAVDRIFRAVLQAIGVVAAACSALATS